VHVEPEVVRERVVNPSKVTPPITLVRALRCRRTSFVPAEDDLALSVLRIRNTKGKNSKFIYAVYISRHGRARLRSCALATKASGIALSCAR
jgi:hypothetical protein